MNELHNLTVAQAAARIRAGELSPVALVEALLERIERLDPCLCAWATLDKDGALEAARRCQEELHSGGPRGPLHGVPMGVKDIYYTAGLRTSAGSPLYADFVPSYDATAVARLKAAGAIVLGKTVTTQFACYDPPPTRNPWNAAHTPGGSSSGSAVAVAARMCPAALGSQTAGSVLRPAAYNGVVGLKPTYGRISRYGVFPFAWTLDTMGFMTRTVEDAALLLGVLAGHDPEDERSSRRPVPDYLKAMNGFRGSPRIGVVRQFFWERAAAEVQAHTDEIVRRLQDSEARVQEIRLPDSFARVHDAHSVIMATEAAAFHREMFLKHKVEYAPKMRATVERGLLYTGVEYVQAQRHRARFRREAQAMLSSLDVLLTPTTPSPAPPDLTTTGDPAFQVPWTVVGFPTITIPSGLSTGGLPLGIQLVAAPFEEAKLLAVARWCERVLALGLVPPDLE